MLRKATELRNICRKSKEINSNSNFKLNLKSAVRHDLFCRNRLQLFTEFRRNGLYRINIEAVPTALIF